MHEYQKQYFEKAIENDKKIIKLLQDIKDIMKESNDKSEEDLEKFIDDNEEKILERFSEIYPERIHSNFMAEDMYPYYDDVEEIARKMIEEKEIKK